MVNEKILYFFMRKIFAEIPKFVVKKTQLKVD